MLRQKDNLLLQEMIDLLLAERGEPPQVPQFIEEKDRLAYWRALVNQRPAGEASSQYLELEAAFLQAYQRERQTSLSHCRPTKYQQILLYDGDLCHLQVDAVVNAANSRLLGCFIPNHACLDNALHTFAGLALRSACARLMAETGRPEPVGRVRVTPGFHLPASYVFHTVGPVIPKGQPVSLIRQQLLGQCYRACLDHALARGLSSIAFPALSTGEFGYPKDQAARVALTVVTDWLSQHDHPLTVVFSVFTEEDRLLYDSLLLDS